MPKDLRDKLHLHTTTALATTVAPVEVSLDDAPNHPGATQTPAPETNNAAPSMRRGALRRGLSEQVSTTQLQSRSWTIALQVANRFRVIRTLDVAVACYPERPYKTALGAAQRAVRGLVKAKLLQRYKTSRFQTTYGLTAHGAAWLMERGMEARASVRRVCDMTNPEHLLWAQCLVLCAEQRGLRARTERELLKDLNVGAMPGSPMRASLLEASAMVKGKLRRFSLRPDAVAFEADGLTAIEVDCSARGSHRAAALTAQVLSIGRQTELGPVMRRLVIYCRTPRIQQRVSATLRTLQHDLKRQSLQEGRRQLKAGDSAGSYEVWRSTLTPAGPEHWTLQEVLVGHVIVQELPVWLPKVRIDARNQHSMAGWFEENFLPWRRPDSTGTWSQPGSPLLKNSAQL